MRHRTLQTKNPRDPRNPRAIFSAWLNVAGSRKRPDLPAPVQDSRDESKRLGFT